MMTENIATFAKEVIDTQTEINSVKAEHLAAYCVGEVSKQLICASIALAAEYGPDIYRKAKRKSTNILNEAKNKVSLKLNKESK